MATEFTSINDDHFNVIKIKHKQLENVIEKYSNVENFNFSCIDAMETKKCLEKMISANKGFNTIIAPMNNKISTVGAALLAFQNKEIQLCYSSANVYNYDSYSLPSDTCYTFEIEEILKN